MVDFIPSWIAAPILAQRNIELAEIIVSYDSFEQSTVFAMRATNDTIAVFRVASIDLAACRNIQDVRAMIESYFHKVEFTSGKSVVPEIQPAIPEPDRAIDAPPAETGSDDGSSVPDSDPASDPAGEPETPADDAGAEPEPGQHVEPVDGGGE